MVSAAASGGVLAEKHKSIQHGVFREDTIKLFGRFFYSMDSLLQVWLEEGLGALKAEVGGKRSLAFW